MCPFLNGHNILTRISESDHTFGHWVKWLLSKMHTWPLHSMTAILALPVVVVKQLGKLLSGASGRGLPPCPTMTRRARSSPSSTTPSSTYLCLFLPLQAHSANVRHSFPTKTTWCHPASGLHSRHWKIKLNEGNYFSLVACFFLFC